ncbi:DUF3221 domain-containing protein [Lederbergia citrisecunda]|uniref:DUF3221 domain-containing protein n=1 Tax=Lederbergia citrisecunda TaxID=2833583 RepID=UPI003D2C91E3
MKNKLLNLLVAALLLGGCGTGESTQNGAVEDSGWKTLKKVSGREIIAELKQTVDPSPEREKAIEALEDYPEFGEPTTELKEDLAVQAIEGPAAIESVEEVYGNFEEEGILFFENQRDGAEQSGIWIGVKEPDERVQKLLDMLQPRVDAGEIVAEPIYIFRSPHTQQELYDLQEDVLEVLKGMEHGRGSFGLSANTVTSDIEITHDFLKPEQQEELKKQFPDHTFHFTQEGKMVAEPGESSIIWPEETFTDSPVEEGGFILSIEEKRILVVGGSEDATYYSFPEAGELKVGQRVNVEASGGILESYPAQGSAKFVEVLPDYKPIGAVLSESQAVVKVLDEFGGKSLDALMVIKDISYDVEKKVWVFKILQGNEEVTFEVVDQ